jgi:hypothetical protein
MSKDEISVVYMRSWETAPEIRRVEVFEGSDVPGQLVDCYVPKAVVELHSVDADPEAIAVAIARALGLASFYYRITATEVRRPRPRH